MVQQLKSFIRTYKKIVLLSCDYYDTKHFPNEMIEAKGNLALFPVANIPLIDYIVHSLISQSFNNIILCGTSIKNIFEHVKNKFGLLVNVICQENESNLGDFLRFFNDVNYDLNDMLILYANHFTNFNLNMLYDEHINKGYLATYFIHKNTSNSHVKHFYGAKNDEIVFYERVVNDKINFTNLKEKIKQHRTIEFNYKGSSPNIAVISSKVFQLFTNNFDFYSLGDLLESILAFNPFNLKIGFIDCSKVMIPSLKNVYNKEIITLYDYYVFNEDSAKYSFFNNTIYEFDEIKSDYNLNSHENGEIIENTILGLNNKLEFDFYIKDSFVGNRCILNGNINRCIIWDDVHINEDLNEKVVINNNLNIDVYHLEIELEVEEVVEQRGNFFDNIIDYLSECERKMDIKANIDNIITQVNLIKISWNASIADFIEAFVIFLVTIVNEDDMEESTINASLFFPLLEGNVKGVEEQETLLALLYKLLNDRDYEFKKQVLFRYGFLLIEDGIITKNILKKYKKMLKLGVF